MTWDYVCEMVVPILNFCLLSFMLVKSRRWTGPAQSVRLEMLEDEVHSMRGNLARVDRDLTAWHRAAHEANASILREIEGIRQMLAEKESLHIKVGELSDRVEDVEQAISGLPCGQRLLAACPSLNVQSTS